MPPYKALGFLVWHGARIYLKQRYGGGSKRLGIVLAVVGVVGVAVVAQRRAGGDDE
ncbi:MAG TPA: hypothetical protein VGI54_04790 [Solirubrobacteraceae bacterium]